MYKSCNVYCRCNGPRYLLNLKYWEPAHDSSKGGQHGPIAKMGPCCPPWSQMGLYSPPWRAIWPHFGSMGPCSPPGGLYGPKPPAIGKKEGGKHFLTPRRVIWPQTSRTRKEGGGGGVPNEGLLDLMSVDLVFSGLRADISGKIDLSRVDLDFFEVILDLFRQTGLWT